MRYFLKVKVFDKKKLVGEPQFLKIFHRGSVFYKTLRTAVLDN